MFYFFLSLFLTLSGLSTFYNSILFIFFTFSLFMKTSLSLHHSANISINQRFLSDRGTRWWRTCTPGSSGPGFGSRQTTYKLGKQGQTALSESRDLVCKTGMVTAVPIWRVHEWRNHAKCLARCHLEQSNYHRYYHHCCYFLTQHQAVVKGLTAPLPISSQKTSHAHS